MIKRLFLISLILLCTCPLFADNIKLGDNVAASADNEIITRSKTGELYIFNKDGDAIYNLYLAGVSPDEDVVAGPVLINIDGDPLMEIAIITKFDNGSSPITYTLRYIDNSGTLIAGADVALQDAPFSLPVDDMYSEPVLANLNNDNIVEVYYIKVSKDDLYSKEIAYMGTPNTVIDGISIEQDFINIGSCLDTSSDDKYFYVQFDDFTVDYYDYDGFSGDETDYTIPNLKSTFFKGLLQNVWLIKRAKTS